MKAIFSVILMICMTAPAFAEKQSRIKISGMMCGACEGKVKNALNGMDGVEVVDISSSKGIAVVKVDDQTKVTEKAFKDAIQSVGFSATSISSVAPKQEIKKKTKKMKKEMKRKEVNSDS